MRGGVGAGKGDGARAIRRVLPAVVALLGIATILPIPAAADERDAIRLIPLMVVYGLDSSVPLAAPRAIAIDRDHAELLLANTSSHRIEVFDLRGNRRGGFIHRARTADGDTIDGLPVALALDSNGHLLVVDQVAAYVDVLDFRGQSVAHLELGDDAKSAGDSPACVAVTADGTILVATRGETGRVHQFGPDLRWLGAWGVAGTEPGHLSVIRGMAMTPDGNVVMISPTTQWAVQVFSVNGRFIRGFGTHEVGEGNFSMPSGVTVSPDGRIWVSDELRQTVQVFSPLGALVGVLGGGGKAPGEFLYPSALAAGGDSLMAVAERVGNRFQLFRVQ